jgi:type I restriction enzyme, S subunit
MNRQPTIPLGDAVRFIRGITFKPSDLVEPFTRDSIVCMRTKNIQADLDQTDLIAVPSALVRKSEKILRDGDILLSNANSWELVGKVSYVPKLSYIATAGGFISIVRPKPDVHARYLYHWLTSPTIQHKLRHCGRQTTNISNLDVHRFKEICFPAVPLNQQSRIADILDKADVIRRKHEETLALADRFMRGAFVERFGDPVSNTKGLPRAPIKEIARIVTGNTPPRKDASNFGQGIEWIKSDNIDSRFHYLTEAKETLSSKGRLIGRVVPAGSILVTCIAGSANSIGNAALADREVAFNQQINAAVPHPDVDPLFLYCQFILGKRLIQSASTNSMKGMVSKGKFEDIEFLLPPYSEQRQFGDLFQKVIHVTAALRSRMLESKALCGGLEQRAFRGEL